MNIHFSFLLTFWNLYNFVMINDDQIDILATAIYFKGKGGTVRIARCWHSECWIVKYGGILFIHYLTASEI